MDLKDQLITYFMESYKRGLNTLIGGNASIRIGNTVYITPSGIPKTELTRDHVVELDLDGNIINGSHRPSSEWRMHIYIYRNSNAAAVLHAHTPHIIALYSIGLSIDPGFISEVRSYIRSISVVPFITPGTQELAEAVASKVKEGSDLVVLMRHGIVAIGNSLADALNKAEVVEEVAKAMLKAKCLSDIIH